MGGELIGLGAVTLGMGVPLGALYTYYRVRKLRSEERLAAIARGVDIPMEPELNQAGRSRRAGILLVSGALGYIATFGLIAGIQADRDIWTVAAFGIIRRRNIVERHVNIFALGFAVFDQHICDAFRNFSFLLQRPAFHPGNLHMRHMPSSLKRFLSISCMLSAGILSGVTVPAKPAASVC